MRAPHNYNTQAGNQHSMSHISIAARIFPTEDGGRVSTAILNLFPDANITIEGSVLSAIVPNMDYFIQRMKEQKIRDSARKILFNSVKGHSIMFHLSKQAAFVAKVNFTEGNSTLGDLTITVKTEDIEPNILIQQMTGVI